MENDLTSSQINRQNVLNNKYALAKIDEHLALGGLEFEGDSFFTKQHLMDLFEVSDSTIERYIKKFSDELKNNYEFMNEIVGINGLALAYLGTNIKDISGLKRLKK